MYLNRNDPWMKVLAFGTFDILHKGHEYYVQKAKEHGDHLTVVVARDDTVAMVKGSRPKNDQETRRARVESLEHVDVAIIGYKGDKYAVIEEVAPDIICLGYDQHAFTERLVETLATRGLHPTIVRIDGFQPEKFKSSKLR